MTLKEVQALLWQLAEWGAQGNAIAMQELREAERRGGCIDTIQASCPLGH